LPLLLRLLPTAVSSFTLDLPSLQRTFSTMNLARSASTTHT
jgi:hypothetical protein